MALKKEETRALYRKRAGHYDFAVLIFRLFGVEIDRYRSDTIAALALSPGDVVVELGCGTGLNFPLVENAIGSDGKIVGVDLTDSMLDVARVRIAEEGWENVELIQADVASWDMPEDIDAVFSTLAITLVPEYDEVIHRASQALKTGGRFAVFDMKKPEGWPHWLVRFAAWLNSPFGVSLELAERHPWESIRNYLKEVTFQEYYFGALYLSVGEKASDAMDDSSA